MKKTGSDRCPLTDQVWFVARSHDDAQLLKNSSRYIRNISRPWWHFAWGRALIADIFFNGISSLLFAVGLDRRWLAHCFLCVASSHRAVERPSPGFGWALGEVIWVQGLDQLSHAVWESLSITVLSGKDGSLACLKTHH